MNFQVLRLRVLSSGLPGRRSILTGVLLLAGIVSRQEATGAPAPAPVPAAIPTASPSPASDAATETRNYDGTQQSNYIKTAENVFLEARGAKSTAFVEANNAYLQAGGASAAGLTSKEAVTARREMIQKAMRANDDYLTFVDTQETVYHDELAKTPLIKADVDGLTANFAEHAKTADVKKLRETERDLLKTGDAMMAFLESKYGAWKLNGNKPAFKKSADTNAYSALGKKYNVDVETVQKLSASVNSPLPTPGTSPIPPVSPSPGGAVQPPAAVSAPTTGPTPTAKSKP